MAPESHAGLFYIGFGLFHKELEVKVKTSELLERISEHQAGQHWWRSLSHFEKLSFQRLKREAEQGLVKGMDKLEVVSPNLERRIS